MRPTPSLVPCAMARAAVVVACGLVVSEGAFASACEVAAPNLVAHYRFDGDATDASASGIDGTATGGVGFVTGVCGQALDLDGVDDAVAIAPTVVGSLDVFTLSLWMRVDTYPPAQAYVVAHDRQNGDTTPNKHFDVRVGGVGIFSGWEASNGANASVEDPLFSTNHGNDWVHVALTRDASGDGALWVDGVLVDTTSGPIETANPDDWLVGAIRTTASAGSETLHFDGAVDELRIYDRALASAEIASLASLEPEPAVVWSEDFVGESGIPTTPEVNLLGSGSIREINPSLPILQFVNDRLQVGSPFPSGLSWWTVLPDDRTIGRSDVVFRIRREILSFTGVGDVAVGSGAFFEPDGTGALARLEIVGVGGAAPFARIDIETSAMGGMQTQSAARDLDTAASAAILAGLPFDLEMRVDRENQAAIARVVVAGERYDTEPVDFFGPQESVADYFAGYASTTSGNAEALYDVRRAEVAADVEVFAPFLNLDIGLEAGTPGDVYGAAGQPGRWNGIGTGITLGLEDVDGFPTTASADVFAVTTEGPIANTNELLGDHLRHCSVSQWRVDVDDVPDGPVRVLTYAPPGGSTGPYEVNGADGFALSGLTGNQLVESSNWSALRSVVEGGVLTVEERPGATCTTVAGLQIETVVPLPELGVGRGLAFGLLALLALGHSGRRSDAPRSPRRGRERGDFARSSGPNCTPNREGAVGERTTGRSAPFRRWP